MNLSPFLPLPASNQLAWQRTETNAFFHFSPNTYTGKEWGDGTESPSIFNPTELDCRQWARAAKAGGFKIGILTAKHHDGFCLWPSKYTEHSVKNSPWKGGKGDVVREFVDAFRAEGLKVGLYLSPWDRHEESYGDSPRYNDHYCAQLTELLTEYGKLHEVWFDGACAEGPNGRRQAYDWPRFFGIVKELQPDAVTFGDGGTDVRWVGNERGIAGETCWSAQDPNSVRFPGDSGICEANDAKANERFTRILNEGEMPAAGQPRVWRSAECDVSIRPGWFYHAAEDGEVRSVENLVDLYFQSVGRNGLLLLNLPVMPNGLVHATDIERVTAMRATLDRLFACDLARGAALSASAEATGPASAVADGSTETYWAPGNTEGEAWIEATLPAAAEVALIGLQEPIQLGQRIAAHRVEALDANGQWQTLCKGTTVGHKRLHRFEPVKTSRVRVVIEESLATPALSAVQIYAR